MPRKRYQDVRSIEERNALVVKNLYLGKWVVGKCLRDPRIRENWDDAIQEAHKALIRAAGLWEESKGTFSTYAVQTIFNTLTRASSLQTSVVHVPPHRRALGVYVVSGQFPDTYDVEEDREEEIPPSLSAGLETALKEMETKVKGRKSEILRLRYLKRMTLSEIGRMWGISRERTRQIHAQAIAWMRDKLSSL